MRIRTGAETFPQKFITHNPANLQEIDTKLITCISDRFNDLLVRTGLTRRGSLGVTLLPVNPASKMES